MYAEKDGPAVSLASRKQPLIQKGIALQTKVSVGEQDSLNPHINKHAHGPSNGNSLAFVLNQD